MVEILAIRDHETGTVPELREMVEHEVRDHGEALFAAMRQKYPPPRYEILMAAAPTMDAFLHNYPRFRSAKPAGGAGTEP